MRSMANRSAKVTSKRVILAVDVSRDQLDVYSESEGENFQCQWSNQCLEIRQQLQRFKRRFEGRPIVVVVEASGGYQDVLLRIARQLGVETALVSGEAVSKMRVIESNDSGKTDRKDARVIYRLAVLGKTLKHRCLPEPYQLLRQWNQIYEAASRKAIEAKDSIDDQLKALFCEFSMSKGFLYSRSGQAVMQCYGLNPYRIVRSGRKRFSRVMKKAVKGIHNSSLEKLYEQAQISVEKGLSRRQSELLELRLRQLWQDWQRSQERKQQARAAMEALYEECRKLDLRLPTAHKGVINRFHLARLVAETGPLSDFSNWRKLLRWAGLNLRESQIGKWRGKTRISKKGRVLLRKILHNVVFPLVNRRRLFGTYYHCKRQEQKMAATKALVAVMRKFVKMLYGWYRSGQNFDCQRVFACQSHYQLAA